MLNHLSVRYGDAMEYSREALGQVIREHREARIPRWTQQELGEAAGYRAGAAVSLSRIESDLLRQHLGHCVHRAMNSKNASEQEKVIEELVGVFRR